LKKIRHKEQGTRHKKTVMELISSFFSFPLLLLAKKNRGQDRNPASCKIQYPMKNHNKDAV
jgi:hypothetical protein